MRWPSSPRPANSSLATPGTPPDSLALGPAPSHAMWSGRAAIDGGILLSVGSRRAGRLAVPGERRLDLGAERAPKRLDRESLCVLHRPCRVERADLELLDRGTERLHVIERDEAPRDAVADGLERAAGGGGDHRAP